MKEKQKSKYDDFVFTQRYRGQYCYHYTDKNGVVTEMAFNTPGAAQNWIDEKRAKYNENK